MLPEMIIFLSVLDLGYLEVAYFNKSLVEQQLDRLQLGWDTRESAKIGAFGFLAGGLDFTRSQLNILPPRHDHKSMLCLNGSMQLR